MIAPDASLADNPVKGMEDDDTRAVLASGLVDEALEDFEHLLTPEIRLLVRSVLMSELCATPEGQRVLRSVEPDPVVDGSGTVATDAGNAVADPLAKRGSSGSG